MRTFASVSFIVLWRGGGLLPVLTMKVIPCVIPGTHAQTCMCGPNVPFLSDAQLSVTGTCGLLHQLCDAANSLPFKRQAWRHHGSMDFPLVPFRRIRKRGRPEVWVHAAINTEFYLGCIDNSTLRLQSIRCPVSYVAGGNLVYRCCGIPHARGAGNKLKRLTEHV